MANVIDELRKIRGLFSKKEYSEFILPEEFFKEKKVNYEKYEEII